MSLRATGRALGVSRNTVRAVLRTHAQQREQEQSALPTAPARAPRARKIDPLAPRVAQLLDQYPDITAQRVFETLTEEGFGGSYSTVKRYVKCLRPPPKPSPSLETPDYEPGQMAESDWSPYEIPFLDGSTASVQAFSYVLVSSTRKFYEIFARNDLHALMDGHVHSFARFDGCAEVCKYDSQKPVVVRWEGAQPIYNPRFLAFAAHYEFRPEAVRGNPNAKPRVERSFWEFETSFLNGRSFRDLDDLSAQLAHWLDHIVDRRRRHGSTALDRFAEEKPHLVALPRHPYDTARVVYRVCSIDGYVDWDGNRYAVPYDHVTDILPVRITQHELFVYAADLRCVARHQLAPRGAGHKLDPHGYHPRPNARKSPVDLDQLRMAFEQMGEGGSNFFRFVRLMPTRQWAHQARQILLLRERYDTSDLDAALAHAALYGAFECKAVARILAAHAKPRALDEYVAEAAVRRLTETFADNPCEPRDLGEYDRLPVCGASVAPKAHNACTPEITSWQNSNETLVTTPGSNPLLEPPPSPPSIDCDNT